MGLDCRGEGAEQKCTNMERIYVYFGAATIGETVSGLNDSLADGPAHCRHSGGNAEFLKDPVTVTGGSFEADVQLFRNSFSCETLRHENQDLDLSGGGATFVRGEDRQPCCMFPLDFRVLHCIPHDSFHHL